MDIDKAKYQRFTDKAGISERGDLIVWFRDQLNKANAREGYRPVSAGEVAKRLQGVPTHDLGQDLYFIKRKCEEALKGDFPVGATFYSVIKKIREQNREVLQEL